MKMRKMKSKAMLYRVVSSAALSATLCAASIAPAAIGQAGAGTPISLVQMVEAEAADPIQVEATIDGTKVDYKIPANGTYQIVSDIPSLITVSVQRNGAEVKLDGNASFTGTKDETISFLFKATVRNASSNVTLTKVDDKTSLVYHVVAKNQEDIIVNGLTMPTLATDHSQIYELDYNGSYVLTGGVAFDWTHQQVDVPHHYKYEITSGSDVVRINSTDPVNKSATIGVVKNLGEAVLKVTAYKADKEEAANLIAEKEFRLAVRQDSNNISQLYIGDVPQSLTAPSVTLDPVNREAVIQYVARGNVTFTSGDERIVREENGKLVAGMSGSTKVTMHASAVDNIPSQDIVISVAVADSYKDSIAVKVNGNYVRADAGFAGNAAAIDKVLEMDSVWKDFSLEPVAGSKRTTFTFELYEVDPSSSGAKAVTSSKIVTLDPKTGRIVANTNPIVPGTVYVKVSNSDSSDKTIKGGSTVVRVHMNALPAAEFTVDDIVMDLGSKKICNVTPLSQLSNMKYSYRLNQPSSTQNAGIVTLSGNTLTAQKTGTLSLSVIANATAMTRETEKTVKITVLEHIDDPTDVITVEMEGDVKAVVCTEGAKQILSGYSLSKSKLKFDVQDKSIAQITEKGEITALKAGMTNVIVSADKASGYTKAQDVLIPVIVQAAAQGGETEKKENDSAGQTEKTETGISVAKTTGLKVKNQTGMKLKVSWKSQIGVAGYQVYYKINGQSAKKLGVIRTASSKTLMNIPKNTKVTVKVRAYKCEQNGDKVFGKWTAAQTITTDSK